MPRVLVAGETGYLGGYVVNGFKENGYWVRAQARNPYVDDLYLGEVTRPETLSAVCTGLDIVFSSIGITRQTDRLTYKEVDF